MCHAQVLVQFWISSKSILKVNSSTNTGQQQVINPTLQRQPRTDMFSIIPSNDTQDSSIKTCHQTRPISTGRNPPTPSFPKSISSHRPAVPAFPIFNRIVASKNQKIVRFQAFCQMHVITSTFEIGCRLDVIPYLRLQPPKEGCLLEPTVNQANREPPSPSQGSL